MSGALHSGQWYRVAGLRPRLRAQARLHRHRYRGRVWYLLQDAASGRTHRFAPPARLVIGLLDGRRSVAETWAIARRRLGEDAPTQDEVIHLLGQLHAADLLQADVAPDSAEIFARGAREQRSRVRRAYANPMAIRIPLWDPDAFLDRHRRLIARIWSPAGALVWLATVLPALVLAAMHWPELTHGFADRVLATGNLLSLTVVFPALKALHELGHASATKAGGGEVHDMGVVVLVTLPVPYVEASAASAFPSKHRRALVGAAGVAVELFVAALALYAWLLIEPGVPRALLFNVMLVAGVSTLVFNGNPLLRYDAYYVLADLIEIPNLAARSTAAWTWLAERHLLGVRNVDPPDAGRAEWAWLLAYGAASTAYRILVTVMIALFVAGRFFVVGVLMALWAVGAMAVVPLIRMIRHLAHSPRLRRHRGRACAVVGGLALALAGLLLLLPLPAHTSAEGVVWLPDDAFVRAGAGGVLDRLLATPGARVARGDALARSLDPALAAKLRGAEARVAELAAILAHEDAADRAKLDLARARLEHERDTLAQLRARSGDLIARARIDGVFVVAAPGDMPGRYYRTGDLLGYVIGDMSPTIRVVVGQDAIDRVRSDTRAVRVLLSDRETEDLRGRITRIVPAGAEALPSRALASDGGGQIATDPRDTRTPKALERMFQLDVALDATRTAQFGQHAAVRFEHAPEPLVATWQRRLRLLFLSRFGV